MAKGQLKSIYIYPDDLETINQKARETDAIAYDGEPNTSAGLRAVLAEYERLKAKANENGGNIND
jgi:hypothetical protein